ncbi:MAG: T9SS type A sorting domain-containing protein [Saprospiraceae bacterium]|nr:T9SS type A sorting domain-containing protein [Saprospiraceae bacterium]
MLRHVLALFFLFAATATFSQLTVTIDPNPVHGSGSASETDIKATAVITNTSDQVINLMWRRNVIEAPEDWWSWVCDINACYGPTTSVTPSHKPNVLNPDESMNFEVHIRPFDVEGVGQINFEIFDLADTNTVIAVVESTFETGTTSVTDAARTAQLKIYPNPATSYFRVFNDDAVDRIMIYSMVGNPMMDIKAHGGQYNVAGLPQGMYLVRMLAEDQSVIKTVRLSKR